MLQKKGLNYLINNKKHVVFIADKNIGPCIVNRNDYISAMVKKHFGNKNIYERISEEQAKKFMDEAIKKYSIQSP